MAELERDVEDRFFDIITEQKKNPSSNAFGIYQKLVFYRFEEIIKSTFVEFIKYISEVELEKTIYTFMKNPPSTPFVWQIANDYRKFVKKEKLFDNQKYLYELLYFDWMEVELLMREYKDIEIEEFSWSKSYKKADSSRIKKCKYDIINKDYESKRENFLVIYYDFDIDEVMFREINQFIFVLIKKLDKKKTLEDVLQELCIENEIDLDEAKAILQEPIEELIRKRALI